MTFVVFINGPPRAGKDTLADDLVYRISGWKQMKFSYVLKLGTHAALGLTHAENVPGYYERLKDVPHRDFFGKTPREAYIAMSERFMKPLYGENIYGRLLLREMQKHHKAAGFAVSDSGFAAEALPITEYFGARRCALIRIHAPGRGCSFNNDSRSHVTLPGVPDIDLYNDVDGDPSAFLKAAETWLRAVLPIPPEPEHGALV